MFSADALNSIVWRPDGSELAMIVRPRADSFEEWIMVLDVESGNVVSRVPIDILNSQQDRWPTEDWEVEFPVLMGDFENCAAPPELQ